MSLFQAVVLAVVQGFTEFLPISSSAHLALAPWLFGWHDQGLIFDIGLHFGTLAAVLVYFFRDWVQIIAQGFGLPYQGKEELRGNPRLLWLLAAGTVPVAVTGLVLEEYVETVFRKPLPIGFMLIAVGLLMGVADRVGKRRKRLGEVSLRDCLVVGAAQAVAVIPGTSRSGITITAALFREFDREAAARFSFLLSTPAIGGAAVLAFKKLMEQGGVPPGMGAPFVVGIIASAATGCLVIAFFLRFLRRHSLKFFVHYRVIFGIIIIALALFRPPTG
jgi:undecaprenyl-diphosphatase